MVLQQITWFEVSVASQSRVQNLISDLAVNARLCALNGSDVETLGSIASTSTLQIPSSASRRLREVSAEPILRDSGLRVLSRAVVHVDCE